MVHAPKDDHKMAKDRERMAEVKVFGCGQVVMEVSTLTLLNLLYFLDAGQTGAVCVTIHPNRKQFFKYDLFRVACEGKWVSWPVKKMTGDGKFHVCPAPCLIPSAFPATDSGVYWCDTGLQQTSCSVNITVTSWKVILASPAQPVKEGDPVTFNCLVHNERNIGSATFFKDNMQIAISATANLTIYNVTSSDEGLYKCHVPGYGTSPESKLSVRVTVLEQQSLVFLPLVEMILRRVLLIAFYLLSTIVIAVRLRQRQRVEEPQPSEDVIMEICS
ncbi:uncharacterized protein LOC128755834 isoform X2 [Synchiropus splendidus]|uniref:uncharacterized protein LOC128755834 isoform X2 n=1 Tax=Synchiropus splendidus TaxID=270530 RepID=UPI00237E8735|nr:uncharacterized protein LOC128755834 isoform X2 [Synchiropus splendidus]